ncbi:hypothetical protein SH203_02500 [Brevundimonas sp. SH203]|uniref:hypothetical protein n=1 Tax=Brevundimonas sp. SH203 TaxID=345167 RepID=UPI0009D2D614|nr:hypothetical protein [Brevundimonas sp. SH203]GAW42086.1 hypothetical protein SH203_02500 [Brevundimonas sp. SH203]
MLLALHAGPTSAAWAWANQIVAQALSNGWRVVERDETEMTSAGRADWLLSSDSADPAGDMDVLVLGPDFVAADLGRLDAVQLSERFHGQEVPSPDGTRWFASAFVNASKAAASSSMVRLVDAETTVIEVAGLAALKRPGDLGELRAADPALGVYRSDLAAGGRAYWGAALFADGQDRSISASGWQDLTGRVMPVAADPAMSLFSGQWSIEWLIEVDPEDGFVELLFQWGGQDFMKSINQPGLYSIVQSVEWQPGGHMIATITSARPHFQGKVRFSGAVVTYLGAVSPKTLETEELQEGQ